MLTNLLDQMGHLVLRRALPLLLVAVFMAGLLAAPALVDTSQAQTGIVSVDPPSQEVSEGNTGFVDIRSDGLTNIYGAQFTLSFDPTYLEVVDADAELAGVQIATGTCPAPNYMGINLADNTVGTVDYGASQVSPTEPCNGGVIATAEFYCKILNNVEPVTVPITIVESIVSDIDGEALEHTVQHGEIICRGGCPVTGVVAPQGYPGTVEVCLDGTECLTLGQSDLSFDFVVPPGAHSVKADSLHYLASEVEFVCLENELHNLGTTKLRIGDLNEDGTINILDLSTIGGNFNKTEPTLWAP